MKLQAEIERTLREDNAEAFEGADLDGGQVLRYLMEEIVADVAQRHPHAVVYDDSVWMVDPDSTDAQRFLLQCLGRVRL